MKFLHHSVIIISCLLSSNSFALEHEHAHKHKKHRSQHEHSVQISRSHELLKGTAALAFFAAIGYSASLFKNRTLTHWNQKCYTLTINNFKTGYTEHGNSFIKGFDSARRYFLTHETGGSFMAYVTALCCLAYCAQQTVFYAGEKLLNAATGTQEECNESN